MKRISLLVIVLFLFGEQIILANGYQWVRQLGSIKSEHSEPIIKIDESGNTYYSAFTSYSFFIDSLEIGDAGNYLIKFDPNGQIVWVNEFDGGILCFDFDKNDNIILAYRKDSINVIKISTFGESIIEKQILYINKTFRLNDLCVDSNNDILITGCFTDSLLTLDSLHLTNGHLDGFAIKINNNLNEVWFKQWGGYRGFASGTKIISDKLNNYYLTVKFDEYAIFDSDKVYAFGIGDPDVMLIKYNSAGETLWKNQIGGNDDDYSSDLQIDNLGNILVLGTFKESISFENYKFSREPYKYGGFIVKYNEEGKLIFATDLYRGFRRLRISSDGNHYLSGNFQDSLLIENKLYKSRGESDILLAKVDDEFNVSIIEQIGGTGYDYDISLEIDKHNNIYLSGNFQDTLFIEGTEFVSRGYNDHFIAKKKYISTNVDVNIHPNQYLNKLSIYPNPFNPSANIEISITETTNVRIEVYSSVGQKIQTIINNPLSSGKYNFSFNGSSLASGIYYCLIQTQKYREVQKMILLK